MLQPRCLQRAHSCTLWVQPLQTRGSNSHGTLTLPLLCRGGQPRFYLDARDAAITSKQTAHVAWPPDQRVRVAKSSPFTGLDSWGEAYVQARPKSLDPCTRSMTPVTRTPAIVYAGNQRCRLCVFLLLPPGASVRAQTCSHGSRSEKVALFCAGLTAIERGFTGKFEYVLACKWRARSWMVLR